jgi:predicted dehydrogenase
MAAATGLRIGIAGCGHAARIHLDRLAARAGVRIVGCADPDLAAAQALAARVPGPEPVPAFADHRELLRQTGPEALAIFTPHRSHYRLAVDALQAGCHVFIEKPLTTNPQEAADIVGLARGRGRIVAVGHQYRLQPSLVEARQRLAEGRIGPLRLVVASLTQPWLAAHHGPEDAWRFDPKLGGSGLAADAGDHLLDALLWTTGQAAAEVAAFQVRLDAGLDLVTAAAVRLSAGTPATLALSGVSPDALLEFNFLGERGRLHATDRSLTEILGEGPPQVVPLPAPAESIDANFVAAVCEGAPLCCPADQAVETVRLLEAITRSAATGQVVRLA